tara:strand:- start:106 stop:282 length:177 start_codon:yes stop_codon:yes gene_type:complete
MVLFYSLKTMSSKSTAAVATIESQKEFAERVNGWAAMLGIVAALGAYATTGQIIPGIF